MFWGVPFDYQPIYSNIVPVISPSSITFRNMPLFRFLFLFLLLPAIPNPLSVVSFEEEDLRIDHVEVILYYD